MMRRALPVTAVMLLLSGCSITTSVDRIADTAERASATVGSEAAAIVGASVERSVAKLSASVERAVENLTSTLGQVLYERSDNVVKLIDKHADYIEARVETQGVETRDMLSKRMDVLEGQLVKISTAAITAVDKIGDAAEQGTSTAKAVEEALLRSERQTWLVALGLLVFLLAASWERLTDNRRSSR